MGPIGKHVTTSSTEVKEQLSSSSCANEVSCVTRVWLQRSHRAVKRRQDRGSHGRSQTLKVLSLETDHHSRSGKLRVKRNMNRRTHRMRKPQIKAPRPARRRRNGEARERPSHMWLVGLRTCCKTSCEIPGTDRSDATSINVVHYQVGFLRSLTLRICDRESTAGMMNTPFVI